MLSFKAVLCAVLLAGYTNAAPAPASSAPADPSSTVVFSTASSAVSSAFSATPSTVLASTASAVTSTGSGISGAAHHSSSSTSVASTGSGSPSATSSAAPAWETVAPASDDPNYVLWDEDSTTDPQGVRDTYGASIMGPQNVPIALQNPDLLAPPTTDQGSVQNAKWPFALSHNRLQTGGWARQQNVDVMPIAKSMAGVNMRLEVGAVRELHWHKTVEWSYVTKGSVQVSAINSDGQNFLGTAHAGDLWYFPAGVPHSLQATADDPDGAEFLLVFNDGAFSEDSTFLLTDWLAHVPKEVLAKNFKVNMSAFDHIPSKQLYIFPAATPSDDDKPVSDPQGQVPSPFIFPLSKMKATGLEGGSVKVVDSTTFPVSTEIAVAEVTVEPGAIRELHWHPTQDEWTYYLSGEGRVTLFASSSNARTFNYQAGDVGFVPASFGHYVENTGNTTLHFLEIFNTDRFQDISLAQWLALTPPELVKAHLDLDDATLASLSKTKKTVVGPSDSS
ncbi:oxalate decarboxylase [Polyporus arcularius HHB13444]|uniref:Oxalate decarboxylase n=1 Tax=Polyporus arcularius HHB13444 TaxID=1314778 RepID=A0A5C3Q1K9_9APHY|nr:oxalate decarboxylase [Polyporus arcularius HHB13444]